MRIEFLPENKVTLVFSDDKSLPYTVIRERWNTEDSYREEFKVKDILDVMLLIGNYVEAWRK
jgi:hypothetical protein